MKKPLYWLKYLFGYKKEYFNKETIELLKKMEKNPWEFFAVFGDPDVKDRPYDLEWKPEYKNLFKKWIEKPGEETNKEIMLFVRSFHFKPNVTFLNRTIRKDKKI